MQKILVIINKTLDQHKVKTEDRGLLTEAMIAEYYSSKTSIPPEAVESPSAFFRQIHKLNIMTELSKLNEYSVFNLDRTIDLISRMWEVRYKLVHQTNDILVGRLLARVVSEDAKNIPNDYKEVVECYCNAYLNRYQMQDI